MKNIKKLLVLLIFVLVIFPVKVFADEKEVYVNDKTGYKVIIDDKADLVTPEDEERLKDTMIGITENANVIFLTTDNNPSSTKSYADSYLLGEFNGANGVLFLIDMDNRIIWLSASGGTKAIITNSKSESITDNVFRYARNKDYFSCANETFKQVNTLLVGGKIYEPMRHISNVLIAITGSVVLGYIIVIGSTRIKKQVNIKNYTKTFEVSELNAIYIGDHTVYCPPSDSGGGGFSGGGGSSGGGGGGGGGCSGGGHSF